MKIGKLSSKDLEEAVFKQLKTNDKNIMLAPQLGLDCGAIKVDDKIIYVSSDPITGSTTNLGKLAVHINVNDLATTNSTPLGITLTILAPEKTRLEDIKEVVRDVQLECEKLDISVLGGHTEITSAVNQIVLSVTAISIGAEKDLKHSELKKGDKIILTKGIGIEGIGIIAHEKEIELKKLLSDEELEVAKAKLNQLSVYKDGQLAKDISKLMHDVTEGGLLGALLEVSRGFSCEMEIEAEKLVVDGVTDKIANYYNIDPLRLISSGSMLIIVEESKLELLENRLANSKIPHQVIGTINESCKINQKNKERHGVYLVSEGKLERVEEIAGDELYKVL